MVKVYVFELINEFYWVGIVFTVIKVFKFFYLNVSFIFLNVSQELDRTGMFFELFGDFYFGFYFEDENSLVNENPLFSFFSSFFYENGFNYLFSKKAWE